MSMEVLLLVFFFPGHEFAILAMCCATVRTYVPHLFLFPIHLFARKLDQVLGTCEDVGNKWAQVNS